MLRVHFTVDDLARVQMVSSLGPLAESVFALDLFARQGNLRRHWRKSVRAALGDQLSTVEHLVRDHDPVPDLLWLIDRPRDSLEIGRHLDPEARRIAATVAAFGRVAVEPHWNQIRWTLKAHRDIGARVLITKGVGRMLGMLHPSLQWKPPVLEVHGAEDGDVFLNGRGLLLSPASFLADKACVVIDATKQEAGRYIVAYSAPVDTTTSANTDSAMAQAEQALGALVGQTRAAALQVLADGLTNGELADRLKISHGGASKHAAVLREAGLITTERRRNMAVHKLTPLGAALVRSRAEEVAAELGHEQPPVLGRTLGQGVFPP